jgi:hypothetical protein
MGQEMWSWAKGMQDTMGQTFQQYLGMAMPAAEENFAWARDMRRNYEEKVMPQIDSLFADADKYASKEEEMRQRGAAIQDVKSATEAQRAAQLRKLESYGVDPTDTRYAALDKQAGIAEAAASALAANQAGERKPKRLVASFVVKLLTLVLGSSMKLTLATSKGRTSGCPELMPELLLHRLALWQGSLHFPTIRVLAARQSQLQVL